MRELGFLAKETSWPLQLLGVSEIVYLGVNGGEVTNGMLYFKSILALLAGRSFISLFITTLFTLNFCVVTLWGAKPCLSVRMRLRQESVGVNTTKVKVVAFCLWTTSHQLQVL